MIYSTSMKIKDILQGQRSGSKKIGTVIHKNAEQKLAELKTKNPKKYAFVIKLGLYEPENLVFVNRNDMASVVLKNAKRQEQLDGTHVITEKDWNQNVEVLKKQILDAHQGDEVIITFLI